MKTLGIAVLDNGSGGKSVFASEVDDQCTPVPGSVGNIVCDPGEVIHWKNCGDDWTGVGSYTFLVTFERKTIPGKWPFKEPPKPGNRTLTLAASDVDTKLSKPAVKQEWKYFVEVDNNNNINGLDPMIIIRNSISSSVIALAVVAVIVVATVVYLTRKRRSVQPRDPG